MSKRRLEYASGSSQKFWEIEVKGKKHTVTWGKLGTSGQSKAKEFSDAKEARDSAEKLIGQKTKKGYHEIGRNEASPTRSNQPRKKAKVVGTKKTAPSAASKSAGSGDLSYAVKGECWPFEKKGVNHQIEEMRFAPDGKRVCIGGGSDNLVLSDGGKTLASLDVNQSSRCLDVDGSGTKAALGGSWGVLSLNDVSSGKRVAEIHDPLRKVGKKGQAEWCFDSVRQVCFAPGGKEIAWGTSTGCVYISDSESLVIKRKRTLDKSATTTDLNQASQAAYEKAEASGISVLRWSKTGDRLLAATGDQIAWLDANTLKTLETKPLKGIICLALSEDGEQIAIALKGKIQLMDQRFQVLPTSLKIKWEPSSLLFSHHGNSLFAASSKAVFFWNLPNSAATELRTNDKRENGLRALTLHPQSRKLFCGGCKGIHIWEETKPVRTTKNRASETTIAPLDAALSAFDLSLSEIMTALPKKHSKSSSIAGKTKKTLAAYKVHPQVEEYLTNIEGIASLQGPFYLSGGRFNLATYESVFHGALTFGEVLPAAPIGHYDGHEFLLMIESAKVISVHHDLWSEIGRTIVAKDEKRFLAKFLKECAVLDLHGLFALQLALYRLGITAIGNVPDELEGDAKKVIGKSIGKRSLGAAAWANTYYSTLGFLRSFYDPEGEM